MCYQAHFRQNTMSLILFGKFKRIRCNQYKLFNPPANEFCSLSLKDWTNSIIDWTSSIFFTDINQNFKLLTTTRKNIDFCIQSIWQIHFHPRFAFCVEIPCREILDPKLQWLFSILCVWQKTQILHLLILFQTMAGFHLPLFSFPVPSLYSE